MVESNKISIRNKNLHRLTDAPELKRPNPGFVLEIDAGFNAIE